MNTLFSNPSQLAEQRNGIFKFIATTIALCLITVLIYGYVSPEA
jgi:hypothetical protein